MIFPLRYRKMLFWHTPICKHCMETSYYVSFLESIYKVPKKTVFEKCDHADGCALLPWQEPFYSDFFYLTKAFNAAYHHEIPSALRNQGTGKTSPKWCSWHFRKSMTLLQLIVTYLIFRQDSVLHRLGPWLFISWVSENVTVVYHRVAPLLFKLLILPSWSLLATTESLNNELLVIIFLRLVCTWKTEAVHFHSVLNQSIAGKSGDNIEWVVNFDYVRAGLDLCPPFTC